MTEAPEGIIRRASRSARKILRVLWAIVGVPFAVVLFGACVGLMFPVGGGIAHVMFAYSEGGNLGGARVVFVGHCIATVLVTEFLRWTRFPLPWYGIAGVVSLVGLWSWLPWQMSLDAGEEFRRQGLLLAPVLPLVAYASAGVRHWQRRASRAAT